MGENRENPFQNKGVKKNCCQKGLWLDGVHLVEKESKEATC